MDHTEVSCDPVWPDDTGKSGQPVTLRQLYYTMLSVLLFFLPMTIMTFVYAAIIGKLQAQQSQMIELNNNPQKNKNSSRKRVNKLHTCTHVCTSNHVKLVFKYHFKEFINVLN